MLGITDIFEGGLLDDWNRLQSHELFVVKKGDCIAAVNGEKDLRAMCQALRSDGVTMHVLPEGRNVQRFVSVIMIKELCLEDCVVLEWAADGSGTFVVKSVKPALEKQNQKFLAEGRCITQLLEVGDRIISVGGAFGQEALRHNDKPVAITVAKWHLKRSLKAKRFEVSGERKNVLEERWGLDLRPRSPLGDSGCLEVRRIVPGIFAESEIRPGDRLISVNGKTLSEGLSKELTKVSATMQFERWTKSVDSKDGRDEDSKGWSDSGQEESNGFDVGELQKSTDIRTAEQATRAEKVVPPAKASEEKVIDDSGWDFELQELSLSSDPPPPEPTSSEKVVPPTKTSKALTADNCGWDFDLQELNLSCGPPPVIQAISERQLLPSKSDSTTISHASPETLSPLHTSFLRTGVESAPRAVTKAPEQTSRMRQRPAARASDADGKISESETKSKSVARQAVCAGVTAVQNNGLSLQASHESTSGMNNSVCAVEWWPPHGRWQNVMKAVS
eukprot:gnl/MRDRNA2_/MRDRNA2_71893_c0_seq1.p1 gnl/MRDRNA2_/MRDRNA2_71893_c0~~gnl/MRDRNA2_/MRDRNA2_71893_c0_seq1.p1  ORF type:complete len:504 (+),score=104.09 gnl/MRDRNA2_/MRDRNA2_71893_c0_seq1:102-1613(+)